MWSRQKSEENIRSHARCVNKLSLVYFFTGDIYVIARHVSQDKWSSSSELIIVCVGLLNPALKSFQPSTFCVQFNKTNSLWLHCY